jgi:hypothetical protein
VSGIEVRRWSRFGHDRLYVHAADGLRLGHYDLRTYTVHALVAADEDMIARAIAAYLAESAATADQSEAADRSDQELVDRGPFIASAVDQPNPAVMETQWTDLAINKPGAAARARAIALREAGPLRTLLARLLRVHTEERAWRIGADGEEAVAARLARLGPGWRVLHAVPVGERGSDIDHVVIGPGGVFTINTKNHPGANIWVGGNTFLVNGQRVPYIRNSRHETLRAGRLLSAAAGSPVQARALIAVTGARRGFTIRDQPVDGRVVVVTRKGVATYLRAQPEVLTADLIERPLPL